MKTLLTFLVLLNLSPLLAQERCRQLLCLSAEDEAPATQPAIPDEVWTVLSKELPEGVAEVPEGWGAASNNSTQPFRNWFVAHRAKLSRTSTDDLIISAEGPLRGANITEFWIFTHEPSGYRLALTVPAHDLVVEQFTMNGYHTLLAVKASCCRIDSARFRYEHGAYKLFQSDTQSIR